MQAGAGETVKPGQFPNRQIVGIPAGILIRSGLRATARSGILLENRGFLPLSIGADIGSRLRFGLPTPEGRTVLRVVPAAMHGDRPPDSNRREVVLW
jgi:hypothetical protein